jgi:hypothetical protein
MKETVCVNCGAVLDDWGYHLCRNASFMAPNKCEYCGETTIDPRHICKPMYASLKYSCSNCGRLAVEEQFLCKPSPIG